ncbi:MAG: hypothetical protein KAI34_03070 [Candidatus Lokiarchaeota archaeon]|nr:hypothetical protein [Candidatus Lokiarchaeota archaeon]
MQTASYPPVTILSLTLFTFLFYTVMFALGGLILWAFTRFENQMQQFDLLEKLALSVALGSALIPLIVFVLTPISGFTNVITIIITVCALVFIGIIALKNKEQLKPFFIELKSIHPIIVITLAISFGIRLFPTLGLYVYPGDDAKFHTFYVYLIVNNKGYPNSFFPFYSASLAYNLGLHALAAFFFYISPFPIEQTILLLTNTYSFLSPVSMYALGKKLFDNKEIAARICFLSGLVAHTPMYFFNWGGNSFILAFFLVPIAVSIAIQIVKEIKVSVVLSALLVIILVGILYVNYLSFFIAICGLIAVNILPVLRKNIKPLFNALLCVFFSMLIVLPRILLSISSTQERESFLVDKLPSWWAKTQIFTYSNFTSYSGLENVFERFVIKDFGGSILLLAFVGILFYLVTNRKRNPSNNPIISTVVWGALLLLIAANGPTGFYFIEFPFWYIFLPRYFRAALILPLLCIGGYGLTKLSNWAGSIVDFKSLNTLTAKQTFQKIIYALILVSIAIESLLLFNYMVGNYAHSAVTKADYEAFMWIQNNTDKNATFFVSRADAGEWIPAIANRRTYPMARSFGDFIFSEEDENKLTRLEELMYSNPNSEEALSLLISFDVDYVYIGKKAIYDRQVIPPTLFLESRNYISVYSDGDVWIFQVIYG